MKGASNKWNGRMVALTCTSVPGYINTVRLVHGNGAIIQSSWTSAIFIISQV